MRYLSTLLLIVFSLLSPPSGASEDDTIVILGDSLSAAYGMEISESWPSLLQDRLLENGHAYRVFNSSIAGETTQGGLTRLPRLLDEHQPAIVIIELGGNDGLRGLPLEVTRDNLASMLQQARQADAEVILAEMRIPPNYGRSYTQRFNGLYTELAVEYDAQLLPFLLQDIALNDELMLDDGIHPAAEAQPLILDSVWTVLEPLLH